MSIGGTAEGCNEDFVRDVLTTTKEQLKFGPMTLGMKQHIRNMLELIAHDKEEEEEKKKEQERKKKEEKKKKPKAEDAATEEVAEVPMMSVCVLCGQEKAGTFCRAGFKCDDCRGQRCLPSQRYSTEAFHIPSSTMPPAFHFPSVEKTYQTVTSILEQRENGNEKNEIGGGMVPPGVKYSVITTPLTKRSRLKVPKLRRIVHPNILYNYAVAVDTARQCVWFVQENAAPILECMKTPPPTAGAATRMISAAEIVADEGSQEHSPSPPASSVAAGVDSASPFSSNFGSFSGVRGNVFGSWGGPRRGSLQSQPSSQQLNTSERQPSSVSGSNEDDVEIGAGSPPSVSSSSPPTPAPTLVRTAATPTSVTVEYEKVKKIAVSLLSAVAHLHKDSFAHYDLRPHNVMIDALGVVKLRCAAFSEDPLPSPFCPPEALTDSTAESGIPADLYALGVTLSIIAYGTALEFPPPDDRSAEDEPLIDLLKQLTAQDPQKRVSASEALKSPYLYPVRFVRGVPVESLFSTISFSEQRETVGSALPGEFCFVPVNENTSSSGRKELVDFFSNHGNEFQVVRSQQHVLTLYSVKSDPRRRHRKGSSSDGLGLGSRRRSMTMPASSGTTSTNSSNASTASGKAVKFAPTVL